MKKCLANHFNNTFFLSVSVNETFALSESKKIGKRSNELKTQEVANFGGAKVFGFSCQPANTKPLVLANCFFCMYPYHLIKLVFCSFILQTLNASSAK